MNMLLLTVLCVTGTVYDDFFHQGNRAYQENRVEDAVVAYEQLVTAGVREAAVFYNLGSAHFQAGHIGLAVLNYERALDHTPGYSPALRGLAAISAVSSRPLGLPEGYRAALKGNTTGSRLAFRVVALVLWWAVWGILAVALWWPPRHTHYQLTLFIGLLAAVLVVVMSRTPDSGVVVAEELPLRYGPDVRDVLRDVLHAGDRVALEMSAHGWTRVETESGQRGWVESTHLQPVALSFSN